MRAAKIFLVIVFITMVSFGGAFAQKAPVGKTSVEIGQETIEKDMPSYANSLKRLVKEAEKNIKRIDKKLPPREKIKRRKNGSVAR